MKTYFKVITIIALIVCSNSRRLRRKNGEKPNQITKLSLEEIKFKKFGELTINLNVNSGWLLVTKESQNVPL